MLFKILVCLGLLAITVAVHSVGLVTLLRGILRSPALGDTRISRSTWLVIRIVWGLMALHTLEIGVWGVFYWWLGVMPDLEAALYFSGVTYASIGYGDLLLPPGWRFFGPIEGRVEILMCGLSTGFFVALLSRIHRSGPDRAGS